jgi:hypothetical protein
MFRLNNNVRVDLLQKVGFDSSADVTNICRVPQLMSVLLTEFLSAFWIFSVFVEIDFVVVDDAGVI